MNEQASLLKAVEEVGLEPREAAEMLDSEELREEVWVGVVVVVPLRSLPFLATSTY